MYRINVRKIGNHWYPDIQHDSPEDLVLDKKLEKIFNIVDKFNSGTLTILFIEQTSLLHDRTIQFAEEDIYRYFITDDEFNIRVYIKNSEFTISSSLYLLLETQFNFNFHKTLYTCEITQNYEI